MFDQKCIAKNERRSLHKFCPTHQNMSTLKEIKDSNEIKLKFYTMSANIWDHEYIILSYGSN